MDTDSLASKHSFDLEIWRDYWRRSVISDGRNMSNVFLDHVTCLIEEINVELENRELLGFNDVWRN